jgi:hypothetical protein
MKPRRFSPIVAVIGVVCVASMTQAAKYMPNTLGMMATSSEFDLLLGYRDPNSRSEIGLMGLGRSGPCAYGAGGYVRWNVIQELEIPIVGPGGIFQGSAKADGYIGANVLVVDVRKAPGEWGLKASPQATVGLRLGDRTMGLIIEYRSATIPWGSSSSTLPQEVFIGGSLTLPKK